MNTDVTNLIRSIEDGSASLETVSDSLPKANYGMSGRRFRTLVCELVKTTGGPYLEVGVFRGKTILTSALANPTIPHIAIDNFAQFDPKEENKAAIEVVGNELANFKMIDQDFEEAIRTGMPECSVYFFDATHDYRSQIIALMNAPRFLKKYGIILVDDTNYHHVRYCSYDFVTAFPDYKLVADIYTGLHPGKKEPEDKATCLETWWNGVHVIVHDPDNEYENVPFQWADDIRAQIIKSGTAGCDSTKIKSHIAGG